MIEFGIVDYKGQQVEPPLHLDTSYTLQIIITNTTRTLGGTPLEADLEIFLEAGIDGVELIPYSDMVRHFSPGQTQIISSPVYIPKEYAGLSGSINASIFDLSGNKLASGKAPISVGYELSPDAVYLAPAGVSKAGDIPFLNPDMGNEAGVVMGTSGSKPPAPPPAPPKPKPVYNPDDKRVPLGIDYTPIAEPEPESEGEVVIGGRLG